LYEKGSQVSESVFYGWREGQASPPGETKKYSSNIPAAPENRITNMRMTMSAPTEGTISLEGSVWRFFPDPTVQHDPTQSLLNQTKGHSLIPGAYCPEEISRPFSIEEFDDAFPRLTKEDLLGADGEDQPNFLYAELEDDTECSTPGDYREGPATNRINAMHVGD